VYLARRAARDVASAAASRRETRDTELRWSGWRPDSAEGFAHRTGLLSRANCHAIRPFRSAPTFVLDGRATPYSPVSDALISSLFLRFSFPIPMPVSVPMPMPMPMQGTAAGAESHRSEVSRTPLPVIGLAELLKNKRASGRPKDHADVARLEHLRRAARSKRRSRPNARRSRPRKPRKASAAPAHRAFSAACRHPRTAPRDAEAC
jgi:hypothetical protein